MELEGASNVVGDLSEVIKSVFMLGIGLVIASVLGDGSIVEPTAGVIAEGEK